eukprot:1723800-Alexandrium_andersonii.AAC.1
MRLRSQPQWCRWLRAGAPAGVLLAHREHPFSGWVSGRLSDFCQGTVYIGVWSSQRKVHIIGEQCSSNFGFPEF